MIIEFSITNFRSIHQKQVFSMQASSARSKADNIFEQKISNGDSVTLTKAAVLYGANASGKSTIVLAFECLKNMIIDASNIKIDEPIPAYQPFLFNPISAEAPSEFEIIFIADNKKKYRYLISFNTEEILKEELYYYPKNNKARNIFRRPFEKSEKDANIHFGRLGKEWHNKKYDVHKKLPLLSIFGNAENYHSEISDVYSYFKYLWVFNAVSDTTIDRIARAVKVVIQGKSGQIFKTQIEKLINVCDTQILSIQFDKNNKEDNPTETLLAEHNVFQEEKQIGTKQLTFNQESVGTNRLFAIGGSILVALEGGRVIILDELDSSLHPYISRFLVKLFLNPISNPLNAQLIFTTHEPNLMDKDMLRADQIWFTEKTKFGETNLFSAQDFDGVREDIPFDKWYMAGKFGAVPNIADINFIFDDEKEN